MVYNTYIYIVALELHKPSSYHERPTGIILSDLSLRRRDQRPWKLSWKKSAR